MTRQSQAWKAHERAIAAALGGRRISRGDDFSRVDVDVVVDDFPFLRIDGKYRQRHAHHQLLTEIRKKYCEPGDMPVLVTKQAREHGAVVSVSLEDFGRLLDMARTAVLNAGHSCERCKGPLNSPRAMGIDMLWCGGCAAGQTSRRPVPVLLSVSQRTGRRPTL